jgi:putative radical SAM enzyme (TIGR03279 family)
MVKIKGIVPKSKAEKAGVTAADSYLTHINGFEINDFLDYDYYNKETKLELTIKTSEKTYTISIYKDEYEDIGLTFETFLMDEVKSCRNNCLFCFIDQNPPGMRESIYFKDDDSRLSFLSGNYITLTNLTDADIERIIKMKLPINVSLHTMRPDLRVRMMNNRFAGERINDLKRIAKAGNKINIQLVLCRGINDGFELRYTLHQLFMLPTGAINGICAVPAGLTKHREGLPRLGYFDDYAAESVIKTIAEFAERFRSRSGRNTVYASDEFFLIARKPIPPAEYYDDFPQYENGVGFIRSFTDEFLEELRENIGKRHKLAGGKYIAVTGFSAYRYVSRLVDYASKLFNINTYVKPVQNNFFGGGVTVTGLLTGSDIIEGFKNEAADGTVLLLSDMLKSGTEIFLDDKTVTDVKNALNMPVEIINRNGAEFFRKIAGL